VNEKPDPSDLVIPMTFSWSFAVGDMVDECHPSADEILIKFKPAWLVNQLICDL
jgi:hypothetical protein